MFNDYVLAFELTSVLLVVAVAGTVVMTRRLREPDATEPTPMIADVVPSWYLVPGARAVLFGIGAVRPCWSGATRW